MALYKCDKDMGSALQGKDTQSTVPAHPDVHSQVKEVYKWPQYWAVWDVHPVVSRHDYGSKGLQKKK